ncbi:hypothetical protein CLAIMM_05329 [Cladophialophora immunda]|nr:hypothetical protein CLAIMM_05329 [Cladophialophora immunda]
MESRFALPRYEAPFSFGHALVAAALLSPSPVQRGGPPHHDSSRLLKAWHGIRLAPALSQWISDRFKPNTPHLPRSAQGYARKRMIDPYYHAW